jgi:hypothetical protein
MDDPELVAYDRARTRVIEAESGIVDAKSRSDTDLTTARIELAEAHTELDTATGPLEPLVAKAWDNNVGDVQAAKSEVVAAVTEQVRVELECGNAARARQPTRPVLSVQEIARCRDAEAATGRARQALDDTRARFKAGVTVEQIVEADT